MTRDVVLDVSRLVWRVWSGRLPTGIDRVCLAYLDHYGPRARAAVQWRGARRILPAALSDRLFALLRDGEPGFRRRLAALVPAMALAHRGASVRGQPYLNVGHTGLDDPALPAWLAAEGLRPVFMVHDLIPITHPQFCREGEGERHARRMAHALASGAGIIANSWATLDELAVFAARAGLAMPPARAAWISGCAVPQSLEAIRFDRPHFITVGTIEGRKNHLLLLRLWAGLARRLGPAAPRLVIVGQRGWQAAEALAMLEGCPDLRGHVDELSSCGDAELAGLVAGARALLMPSFAEGFGLPVIEALQLGTPVIASDLPVYREIAGHLPVFLDPCDGAAWEREVLSRLTGGSDDRPRVPAFRAPGWPDHFARVDPWLATLSQKEGGAGGSRCLD